MNGVSVYSTKRGVKGFTLTHLAPGDLMIVRIGDVIKFHTRPRNLFYCMVGLRADGANAQEGVSQHSEAALVQLMLESEEDRESAEFVGATWLLMKQSPAETVKNMMDLI